MVKSFRLVEAVNRTLQGLLLAVVVGVIYRYCWIDVSDPFKCDALLNKGQWIDSSPRWRSERAFQNWQPPGCLLREYTKEDVQGCFRTKRLVFIGDSTTRQIFWAVAQKLDRERADMGIAEVLRRPDYKHTDLEFYSHGVMLQFVWDTWLNSTRLSKELEDFDAYPQITEAAGEQDSDIYSASAGLVLLGAPGLWYARHGQENYYKGFRDSIDAVIPYMDHSLQPPSTRSSFSSRDRSPNLLLLAPVQVPWYQDLSPSREETITPEKIDQMNEFLHQVSAHSKADILWSYSLITWEQPGAYEESGLHVVSNVAHRKADILLNLRCNADGAQKSYPFDGTCCSNYVQPGHTQYFMIFVGMLLLPAVQVLRRKQAYRMSRLLPSLEVISAFSHFALVLCYCFYADRTQIFTKAHKQFQRHEFITACVTVLGTGMVFIRKNTPSTKGKETAVSDPGFLPREQTEEWKGWMQFIILIYHYTHASNYLRIYETVRLFIASYLFMTGFGHTLYFLKKEDYSLRRVASVLVRLNMLSCLLPYIMRTDYMFYYFAPLVSFWFLVVYFTLRLNHGMNDNLYFLLAKILLSILITTAFTMIPGILEFFAIILRTLCNISWDVAKWRFHVFLDMYVVYVGMIAAILFYRARNLRAGQAPDTFIDLMMKATNDYIRLWRIALFILASILLPLFWNINGVHTNKQDYDSWNSYLAFFSVLSFMILRNSHQILRQYHSALFAWLGRCSLETYVLQYHIWLAGDTKGLLRLGLWDSRIEGVVLTALFLWISHGVANATQVLTNWIIDDPSDRRLLGGSSPELRHFYRLPFDQVGDVVDPRLDRDNDKSTWRSKKRPNRPSGLKLRLGLIAGAMWVANITYR